MRFVLLIFLSIASKYCFAQLPFVQAIQAPLAINPSMAGNKNKNRISTVYNQLARTNDKQQNIHLSFDTFLKKLGAGVGVFYTRQNYATSSEATDPLINSIPNKSQKQVANTFGIAFAPKYNVMEKVYFQEIKYSISPSFYVSYSDGNRQKTDNFRYSYHQNCNCAVPNVLTVDSASYTQSKVKEKVLVAGIGLMYTSNNLLFFARLQHETGFYKENFNLSKLDNTSNSTVSTQSVLDQRLYSLQGIIGAGISLPKNQESKFTATPFAAIGMRRNLNLEKTTNDSENLVYSENLAGKSKNEIPFSHVSLNLRYKHIIGGGAYTHALFSDFYGFSVGFQNAWSKTLVSVNMIQNYTLYEVGTGVWF
jgi:hypothetical protein